MTTTNQQPWSMPFAVDTIAETGSRVGLVADAATRAAVAALAGLRTLPEFAAEFDLIRTARGVRVSGRVSATVGQTCVISLEPIENRVEEAFGLLFVPGEPEAEALKFDDRVDDIERLSGDTIDLGAIAVEFLILGVNQYPRKSGVKFESVAENSDNSSPFAALEALKNDPKTNLK